MATVAAPVQPAPGPCAVCPLRGLHELWAELHTPLARDRYLVSTHGRVRNGTRARPMKLRVHPEGYVCVNLGRSYRNAYVHRLVALAFLGPPPADGRTWEVDHLDFDRAHNVVHNVRWLPKDVNAWRWKFWSDHPDPDQAEPLEQTAAELAAWAERMRANGWPEPPLPRPDTHHRHLTATGATP